MIWALGAFLDNPAGSSHHSGYKGMDSRTTQGIYILPNCCKKPSLECAETNIPPQTIIQPEAALALIQGRMCL